MDSYNQCQNDNPTKNILQSKCNTNQMPHHILRRNKKENSKIPMKFQNLEIAKAILKPETVLEG